MAILDFAGQIMAGTIVLAMPVIIVSLGECIDQQSGTLNLGLEGIMLMGAFFGLYGSVVTGNIWLGFLTGMAMGATLGVIHAILTVTLNVDQIVSGLALWIVGLGVSGFFFRTSFGTSMESYVILESLSKTSIPLLDKIPVLGPSIFNQNLVGYITLFFLVPLFYIIIFKTTIGLKIRSIGEDPLVAETLGVKIEPIRYLCIIVGAMMGGLGGSFITLGITGFFEENMVAGRGFVAFAMVWFGNRNPVKALAGALLFGFLDALQMRLQTMFQWVPYPLFLLMPYLATLIVLMFSPGSRPPKSLGVPYLRGKKH